MKNLPYNPEQLQVLVVDDHDPMRKSIKRVIEKMHFKLIQEAWDVPSAMTYIDEHPVDLIICDLVLRDRSGTEIIGHVRSRPFMNEIPIIVVSGEASKEDIVKSVDQGGSDYLLKPFQVEDLENKIDALLTGFFAPSPLLKNIRAGERLMFRREYKGALAAFKTAIEIDRSSARANYGIAASLAGLKLYADAERVHKATLLDHPSFYRCLQGLADIAIAQGDPGKAIKYLQQELEHNPRNFARQMLLGHLELDRKSLEGAKLAFRAAIKESPRSAQAMYALGSVYDRMGNIEKAITTFQKIRRYYPTDSNSIESIVQCSVAAGQPKRAEHALKDEKREHPERIDTYLVLAKFCVQQKRIPDGMANLGELLGRQPDHEEALTFKASVLMQEKNYAEAMELYTQIQIINPKARIHIFAGECLLLLQRYGEAISMLITALGSDTENSRIFFMLGEAHRATQQICKCFFMFSRAAHLGYGPLAVKAAATAKSAIIARAQAPTQKIA